MSVTEAGSNRMFSRDVTAAMLVFLNKETATMLVSPTILRQLNSILMLTFSFVLDEKLIIDHVSENTHKQEFRLKFLFKAVEIHFDLL